MDTETPPPNSHEVDLSDFLKVRDESFQRLMQSRAFIREDFENSIKRLESERDTRLLENYALLQQLGMPEDLMPLPPENEEEKTKRLSHGRPRKLSESEIKRVLREMMVPKKYYTASQLLGFLQTTYKDFSEFYQKNGHDKEREKQPDPNNPPFLYGDGSFRWRTYTLWPPADNDR